ncbi:Uncharacterised protein [Bordetella pertussis]|nr:Uncharacterised protein [Bordetella pertussis]
MPGCVTGATSKAGPSRYCRSQACACGSCGNDMAIERCTGRPVRAESSMAPST